MTKAFFPDAELAGRRGDSRSIALIRRHPVFPALSIIALMTVVRMLGTVDSDVAWQLWIGQRMQAGANLYTDIVETNPPLWFWMAVPVDWIAKLLGCRPEAVLAACFGGLTALSAASTNRLIVGVAPVRRAAFLAYASLVLFAMPWVHLGQREQIVLVATVPYAALVAARRDGRIVTPVFAAFIGIFAAFGFALKHYFVAVPVALELWLLLRSSRDWRPFRPETLAIASVGLAYALALVLFERDYLTEIVPQNLLAYGNFGAPSFRILLTPTAVVGLALFSLTAALVALSASRSSSLVQALLVATAAFVGAYFFQFKGWLYHTVPMTGCAAIALAALLLLTRRRPPPIVIMLAPSFLLLPFWFSIDEMRQSLRPNPDMDSALAGLKPGDTVGFITTESAIPWSVTLQNGYRYASRYNGFWMMHAVLGNERATRPDPRLDALAAQTVANTVADFRCTPPTHIMIWRPRTPQEGVDILPIFARDPQFRELMSHYRLLTRSSLETFELTRPLLPANRRCRQGV